jgi:hypothetical protein
MPEQTNYLKGFISSANTGNFSKMNFRDYDLFYKTMVGRSCSYFILKLFNNYNKILGNYPLTVCKYYAILSLL